MENIIRSIIKIILLCCLLLFCIQFFIKKDDYFDKKESLLYDESYDSDISNILTTTKSSDITVKKATDEKIRVVVYGKEKEAVKITKGETLKIELEENHNLCFGFCFNHYRVELYIPESFQGDFNLKTVSGDIKMDNFNQNASISTVSGDIEILKMGNLDIKTTSGDINIKECLSSKISTVSGEVEIQKLEGKIEVSTTSGDVQIENAIITNDSSIKTVSGEVEIEKLANAYVDTKTVSGDVSIKNNDRFLEHTLTIQTTSGDIEVKK